MLNKKNKNINNCSWCNAFEECYLCYYNTHINTIEEELECPCKICLLKTICCEPCDNFSSFSKRVIKKKG